MSILGRVHNGIIELEANAKLEEGTLVRVEPLAQENQTPELVARLLAWAGQGVELPVDLAKNHDHYLHGQQRQ